MLFYLIGLIGIILFEIAKVYFIMPMPGSQEMASIDIAYFLHNYRWIFRVVFILSFGYGLKPSFTNSKIITKILLSLLLLLAIVVSYFFNFKMTAEKMFLQPFDLKLESINNNIVPLNKLVIGIEHNGKAKAYPIQYIAYHHQVVDDFDNMKVMITYCSVCRTGRVFEPKVDGQYDEFRLVGMDHFNAMFEDSRTKSWWRQVNGESIVGQMKGNSLPEILSHQLTLEKWLELYPNSLIMQPDTNFLMAYDSYEKYDDGDMKSKLVGTDFESWNRKSWVIGIEFNDFSKAYDWNFLKEQRFILDKIDNKNLVIFLTDDNKSFFAYQLGNFENFKFENDTVFLDSLSFNLKGESLDGNIMLKKISAYQEFWHSWKTFHPNTLVFKN